MPATELTAECRAVAERLRAFPNMEGHVAYLQKLMGEDSATVVQLVPVLEAVRPKVEPELLDSVQWVAAMMGAVAGAGGNVALWPKVAKAADDLIIAVDIVDADTAEAGASA